MAKRRKKRKLRIGRLLVLLIGFLLVIFLFFKGIGALFSLAAPKPEVPAETPEPTPTPDPINKNDYDMQYLSHNEGIYTYEDENYTSSFDIDVSHYQGTINWEKVKEAGVQFVFIRAGYRGSTTGELHEDTCYRENIKGAVNAGLEVGVYFFSQAVSPEEAEEEAGFLLSLIQEYPVSECVYDLEYSDEGDRASENDQDINTAAAASFCKKIWESGYVPLVYGSTNFMYHDIRMEDLQDFTEFWIASYGKDTPEFPYVYRMWQYACDGEIDGIDTVVDFNIRMDKKA